MGPTIEFIVECRMPERWAAQFLGLLRAMEAFGNVGHSGHLVFMSDGDGDYNPKFKVSARAIDLPNPAIARQIREVFGGEDPGGILLSDDYYFDAG